MIDIYLDSVWKVRNASEGRWINRASAEGIEETGDGDNIVKLAKRLLEAGHSGEVEVRRGTMPVFSALPLTTWAAGGKKARQPEHLRKSPALP